MADNITTSDAPSDSTAATQNTPKSLAYVQDTKTGDIHALDYTDFGTNKDALSQKGMNQVIPVVKQDTGEEHFLSSDDYTKNFEALQNKGYVRADQGYKFKPLQSESERNKQTYKESVPNSEALDFLTGLSNDVALGIPKAAVAGGTALVNKLQGDQGSFSDLYSKQFNKLSDYAAAAKERSPIAGNAGSITGSLAAPLPEAGAITEGVVSVASKLGIPAETVLELAKNNPRIAAMLETGAGAGVASGLSTGIQTQGDVGAAGKSAALGAGLGAGAAGVLGGISGLGQKLQESALAENPATKAAMETEGLPQFIEQQTPQGVKGGLKQIQQNVGDVGKTAEQITKENIIKPAQIQKGLANVEAGEASLTAKQATSNYKDLSKQLKDTIESDTSSSLQQTQNKLESAKQIADELKANYGRTRDNIFEGLSLSKKEVDPSDIANIIKDTTDASSPAFAKANNLFQNKYLPRIQQANNQGEALRAVDDFQKEIGQGIYMNLPDGSIAKVPNALLKGLKSNLTNYVTDNAGHAADSFKNLQQSYADASAISNIVDATKIRGLQAYPGGAINAFGKIQNVDKLEKFLENQPLTNAENGGANILKALEKYSPDTAQSLVEAQQMVRNLQGAYSPEAQALAGQTQAAQKAAQEAVPAALASKGGALGAQRSALNTAANPLESDYYKQLPEVQQRLLKTMDELKQAKLSGKNLNFSDQMQHILQNSKEYANIAPDIVNDIDSYSKYEPIIKDILARVPSNDRGNVLDSLAKIKGVDKVVKYFSPAKGLEGLSELSRLQRAPQENEKYNRIISLLSQAGASKLNKNNPGAQ